MKVILNPAAGRGKAGQTWPSVARLLRDAGLDFDLVVTERIGQAVGLAKEAAQAGHRRVVAAGGDGTVQEVVQGLVDAAGGGEAGTLAVIPLGSGNDFAKMIGVSSNPAIAVRRLAGGHVRSVDVGCLGSRVFVNGIGIGFDALVAVESRKIPKLTGLPLYMVAVLRTLLLTYRTPRVHIQMDNVRLSQGITMIAVANGACYGGGFWVAPQADVQDGLLDVVLARELSRLAILRLLPHVVRGTHLDKEPVRSFRSRRVIVEADEPLPIHADGEIWPAAERLDIELLPGKLRVIG